MNKNKNIQAIFRPYPGLLAGYREIRWRRAAISQCLPTGRPVIMRVAQYILLF